ncbi:hypothetical protein DBZ36_09350 [Alginatibacterium sediminis]|uniref:Anti-sigma-E factor RseA n=1 Tax=Alginatibacterium sediminis TaxID=2164068 RepID=A0A420ED54_9ALTE|nr:RseA family anti-sigma factor [Alginatibacterium sediminis]RKF18601.1 hypothetical protein DBZ36_09350 [Alginatibacterium sediminis]
MAKFEQLSALIDGQNDEVRFIDEVAKDEELSQRWQNYHLIGDVMRGECAKHVDLDLSSKIAMAIEDEPCIVAPRSQEHSAEPQVGFAIAAFAGLHQRYKKVFSYAGQYAIAASVAVAAIVGVQHYSQVQPNTLGEPVLHTIPIGGGVSPVSLTTPLNTQEPSQQELLEQNQRINAYLQDHRLHQRIN